MEKNEILEKIGIKFNPFYLYCLTVLIIIILYSFNWSNIYPKLSIYTYIFLISTILISFFVGRIIDEKLDNRYLNVKNEKLNLKKSTLVVVVGFIIEFIYARCIPLVEILILKSNFNYLTYTGIPTIHVLLVTFNSFIAIYAFYRYLIDKERETLYLFLINLLPSMLIFNRGMLTMILLSCVSTYVLTVMNGFINKKKLLMLSILGLIFLYCFGIFGNIRSNREHYIGNNITNSQYIMMVGDASPTFRESIIPKPFFWGYIYITSPLANLENTIQNTDENVNINGDNVNNLLFNSLLPDFISNDFNIEPKEPNLITHALTVCTMFVQPYLSLGWFGMIIMFLYWLFIIIAYRLIVPSNSNFYIVGLSILNTITMFNLFDNMIVFAGLSFQLVYPILFMLLLEKGYGQKLINKFNKLKKVKIGE